AAVLLLPDLGADRRAASVGKAHGIAVVEADHNDDDVGIAARELADDLADILVEAAAQQSLHRAMAPLNGDARLVGELFDEAREQAFGQNVAPHFEAVGVVLRKW